jgi:hypothetical protein
LQDRRTKTFPCRLVFHRCRTAVVRAPHIGCSCHPEKISGRTHILASSTLEPRVRRIELEWENISAVCDVLLFRNKPTPPAVNPFVLANRRTRIGLFTLCSLRSFAAKTVRLLSLVAKQESVDEVFP